MLERIAAGRTDLVFDWIAQGHAATAVDGQRVSLLKWCAYYGDVGSLRFLLSQGAVLAELGDNLDLNGAAFHGHWRLCEFLVEHGADVNVALADTGETPLHVAMCKANRPACDQVLRVLLAHGADPNRATNAGVETDCFMRDCRTRGETPLHRAAAFGTETAIQLLVAAGARLDAKDQHGDSPLSWASWHLRPPGILRLLCYDGFTIHPQAAWTSDHGCSWGHGMELNLLGQPHAPAGPRK